MWLSSIGLLLSYYIYNYFPTGAPDSLPRLIVGVSKVPGKCLDAIGSFDEDLVSFGLIGIMLAQMCVAVFFGPVLLEHVNRKRQEGKTPSTRLKNIYTRAAYMHLAVGFVFSVAFGIREYRSPRGISRAGPGLFEKAYLQLFLETNLATYRMLISSRSAFGISSWHTKPMAMLAYASYAIPLCVGRALFLNTHYSTTPKPSDSSSNILTACCKAVGIWPSYLARSENWFDKPICDSIDSYSSRIGSGRISIISFINHTINYISELRGPREPIDILSNLDILRSFVNLGFACTCFAQLVNTTTVGLHFEQTHGDMGMKGSLIIPRTLAIAVYMMAIVGGIERWWAGDFWDNEDRGDGWDSDSDSDGDESDTGPAERDRIARDVKKAFGAAEDGQDRDKGKTDSTTQDNDDTLVGSDGEQDDGAGLPGSVMCGKCECPTPSKCERKRNSDSDVESIKTQFDGSVFEEWDFGGQKKRKRVEMCGCRFCSKEMLRSLMVESLDRLADL